MPRSQRPRKPYRGVESQLARASRHRSPGPSEPVTHAVPQQDTFRPSRGIDSGLRNSVERVRPSPSHLRPGNRAGLIIATAVGAAGVGGGAYALHRHRRNPVRKQLQLVDPFEGITKADDDNRTGRFVRRGALIGAGTVGAGHVVGGHMINRELKVKSLKGKAGVIAANTAAGAVKGGIVGGGIGGLAAVGTRRQPVGKAGTLLVTGGTNVRSVAPITPSGSHVSHENDLTVVRHRRRHRGSSTALEQYRSGSKEQMRGGGKAYGHQATHVGKSASRSQFASSVGYRGGPLTELSTSGRTGRRLHVQ